MELLVWMQLFDSGQKPALFGIIQFALENRTGVLMAILAMANLDLGNKRVLIREDLNVPVKGSTIVNDARVRAALPSIKMAMQKGAKVMLMSHLGRPKEG